MDDGLSYAVSVLASLLAQAQAENERLRQHVGIPPGMPVEMFLSQGSQQPAPPEGPTE